MTVVTPMKVEDYKRAYKLILDISYDVEEFNTIYQTTEEEIEKCKWIKCIFETLNNVPVSRMEYTFKSKNIEFDELAFLKANKD